MTGGTTCDGVYELVLGPSSPPDILLFESSSA